MSAVAGRIRPRNALKVLIVLFGAVMLFLLVQRIDLLPTVEIAESDVVPDNETWMSVIFQGQKIGYSYQSLTKVDPGYIVDQKSYLTLNLMGDVQELRTLTTARLDSTLGLESFNFFMSAGPIRYQLSGRLEGKNLHLTGVTGGHRTESVLPLADTPKMAAGLIPFLSRQGLEVGQRFSVPIFDPATLSTRSVRAQVEDKETLELDGESVETFRVRMEYFDTKSYTWVDAEGRTIKEEGLMGFAMVRTDAQKATLNMTGRADLADLVRATSAPVTGKIDDPRSVSSLQVRLAGIDLTGFDLDGGRQRFADGRVLVSREVLDPALDAVMPIQGDEFTQYLEPEEFVQSDDPKIKALADRIADGATSPLEITRRIVGWVYENLDKRPTMSVPSAVEVLETRAGDCNEHATLAAALLRAAGIPARIVVGVLYFENRFFYHAWLEVYYGRWIAADPLLGQVPADASHIRFLTGGISKQTDMIRVVGRLEVEIMDAE